MNMFDEMPDWAVWGSLAEEQLAGEAEQLLHESQVEPVDRHRVIDLLELYGQTYHTLPAYLKEIVGNIEVKD